MLHCLSVSSCLLTKVADAFFGFSMFLCYCLSSWLFWLLGSLQLLGGLTMMEVAYFLWLVPRLCLIVVLVLLALGRGKRLVCAPLVFLPELFQRGCFPRPLHVDLGGHSYEFTGYGHV